MLNEKVKMEQEGIDLDRSRLAKLTTKFAAECKKQIRHPDQLNERIEMKRELKAMQEDIRQRQEAFNHKIKSFNE